MPYLGIFRLKFENDIVIFESIYLITKIREKKSDQIWDQKCLIWITLD